MNLLLDTHVLIWWDDGRRLASAAHQAIEKAASVHVSAASAWEVAIKISLDRLKPTRTVAQAAEESGFLELPILYVHAERVSTLPDLHRDPFDRMLVAQSAVEGLVIVTRDPIFEEYGCRVIRA